MTATLRIVLDRVAGGADPELTAVSHELARALIDTSPHGCEVAAITPAGADLEALAVSVPGLADVRKASLKRRELARAWQIGVAPGVGGGMIHSPSLMAPLVKHDRVHDNDQTVVTLWDLEAWERPAAVGRGTANWQKAMLKRAEKYADAVVVPTHAMAARVAELGRFGRRIRVIPGAPAAGFAVPGDAVGRRRTLAVPEGTVVIAGSMDAADAFAAIGSAGLDLPIIVLDVADDQHVTIVDQAAAAGVAESHVHVRGQLDAGDRAAVLDGALAVVAPSRAAGFPWRAVDALALGVPVIASASADHEEVLADGGVIASEPAAMGQALAEALGSSTALDRLAVLAADRGRAFSWREHAERVWALHADL